ncbi:Alpha/Beta hydrolase protein [Massariosphaeria phaeospora]|uniref:Alpha/Beta hydrolase protein n=1 Tax=Massariosphaeria phaeospora TaxID=100035 RepID=A0A7C8IFN6_9PLEO|nr:Alpha/Beta hydrolase protein [Massariosphaeria phaeospora]
MNWDNHNVMVHVHIPKGLNITQPVPVHVHFHGGDFVTGSGDHWPWFGDHLHRLSIEHNAITLCPDYPLIPESNGKELLETIDKFWVFYNGTNADELLEQAYKTHGLTGTLKLAKDRLLVSGESAGGFAAVHSWYHPCQITNYHPIKVLYLQHPMLRHYIRNVKEATIKYMDNSVSKTELTNRATLLLETIQALKAKGRCRTRSSTFPPWCMLAAPTLSITHKWQEAFQGGLGVRDCLEQVEHPDNTPDIKTFPKIFISHGNKDQNCPIENTKKWVERLGTIYKDKNVNWDDLVYLTEVQETGKGTANSKTPVDHAFDYNLHQKDEPWLMEIVKGIGKAWGAK